MDIKNIKRISVYELYHPPFAIRYEDMTLAQSLENLEFYTSQSAVRIEMLQRSMRATGCNAPLDFSLKSLLPLGQWFYDQVGTRAKTPDETERDLAGTPVQYQKYLGQWEIDDQTISIAHDVGLYFSSMLERSFPGSSWDVVRKPKNDVVFRHPVLLSAGGEVRFSPIHIMLVLAHSFASGHRTPDRLLNLFEVWSKHFESDTGSNSEN